MHFFFVYKPTQYLGRTIGHFMANFITILHIAARLQNWEWYPRIAMNSFIVVDVETSRKAATEKALLLT